jgi:NADH:ubiquinone oxidoreductase subunit 2 (subunit N)
MTDIEFLFKYFIYNAINESFILLAIILYYFIFNTFDLHLIAIQLSAFNFAIFESGEDYYFYYILFFLATLILLSSLLFKIGLFPFHF